MKNILWKRLPSGIYRIANYSDEVMLTLALFLEDGLGIQAYVDFLENKELNKFIGNISMLLKKNVMVTIVLNEDIFPNMPDFSIKILNLIKVLEGFRKLYISHAAIIEIIIDEHNQVTIIGS